MSRPGSRGPRRPRVDSLWLRAWRRHLQGSVGMRVQKIHQPEARTLVLSGHPTPEGLPLLLRVQPDGFLAWADPGLTNPAEPPAFCMLLRKHLVGGFLREVTQAGLDRVLLLHVEAKGEGDAPTRTRLVLELTGARPNLHLVAEDDGLLGSLVRYPSDRERFGEPRRWQPPPLPPDPGPDPRDMDSAELSRVLEGAATPRELASRVAGVTRPVAEALLASGAPAASLEAMLAPDAGVEGPFLRLRRGRLDLALAGLPASPALTEAGWQVDTFPDLDELTRKVYLASSRQARRERSRHECQRATRRLAERLERQVERNREAREKCQRADELQATGELLKAHLHEIQPGHREVEVTDYSSGEAVSRTVRLDPKRSPHGNMDHYFQRAKRLRRKAPVLERKAEHLATELAAARALAERAEDPEEDPVALKDELRTQGLLQPVGKPPKGRKRKDKKEKKGRKKKRQLRTFVSSDGLRILVGRSNEENDYLVRRAGKKGDAWLHAEGAAGAHVLVKLAGRSERPPEATLREAAQLAAHFSKLRYEAKARVMLSRIGVVKRAPNSPPGQVLVPEYETVVVRTDPGVVRRLAPLGE